MYWHVAITISESFFKLLHKKMDCNEIKYHFRSVPWVSYPTLWSPRGHGPLVLQSCLSTPISCTTATCWTNIVTCASFGSSTDFQEQPPFENKGHSGCWESLWCSAFLSYPCIIKRSWRWRSYYLLNWRTACNSMISFVCLENSVNFKYCEIRTHDAFSFKHLQLQL